MNIYVYEYKNRPKPFINNSLHINCKRKRLVC